MYSDPISEMTTKLVNGQNAKKKTVETGYSTVKENILKILKEKGFIDDYSIEVHPDMPQIKKITVLLRYAQERLPVIHGIKRVSKPSRRVYKSSDQIKSIMNGYAVSLYSTNKGIITDKQAQRDKVGGEFLLYVW